MVPGGKAGGPPPPPGAPRIRSTGGVPQDAHPFITPPSPEPVVQLLPPRPRAARTAP